MGGEEAMECVRSIAWMGMDVESGISRMGEVCGHGGEVGAERGKIQGIFLIPNWLGRAEKPTGRGGDGRVEARRPRCRLGRDFAVAWERGGG